MSLLSHLWNIIQRSGDAYQSSVRKICTPPSSFLRVGTYEKPPGSLSCPRTAFAVIQSSTVVYPLLSLFVPLCARECSVCGFLLSVRVFLRAHKKARRRPSCGFWRALLSLFLFCSVYFGQRLKRRAVQLECSFEVALLVFVVVLPATMKGGAYRPPVRSVEVVHF